MCYKCKQDTLALLGPGRMYLKVMGLQRDEDLVCSIMKIFGALGASEPNGTGPIQIPSSVELSMDQNIVCPIINSQLDYSNLPLMPRAPRAQKILQVRTYFYSDLVRSDLFLSNFFLVATLSAKKWRKQTKQVYQPGNEGSPANAYFTH